MQCPVKELRIAGPFLDVSEYKGVTESKPNSETNNVNNQFVAKTLQAMSSTINM